MSSFQDSAFSGSNIEFIEALYARYLEDPASVDESWRELFSRLERDGQPIFAGGEQGHGTVSLGPPGGTVPPVPKRGAGAVAQGGIPAVQLSRAVVAEAVSRESMDLQSRVAQMLYAFRLRGHLVALLDPLGRPRPPLAHISDLSLVSTAQFSAQELDQLVDTHDTYFGERRMKLSELVAKLRRTYAHHVGVQFMHILDSERRRWLMERMEQTENRLTPSVAEQRRILEKLSYAEQFESFLQTKYVGAKRFSGEGADSLIPMLDAMLDEGGQRGVREVVVGMAHRGRLNVLTNILRKSPDQIFSEFEGPRDPRQYFDKGDVKYHNGFSSDYETAHGDRIHLSLAFNPSHLEVVDPVVEGRARAKQDRLGGEKAKAAVMPLLIHGDAAFAGQGVVAETFNFARLPGYSTGGTIHVVINNQVGFTTDPEQSRSSIYATTIAEMLDIPIFHVNGDDPEACVHVMRLAAEYRQRFLDDVVIDLVCYRKYGHNETDEPAFTQPEMYHLIRKHPSPRELYAQKLGTEGHLSLPEAEKLRQSCHEEFQRAHATAKASGDVRPASFLEGLWKHYRGGPDAETPDVDTGISLGRAKELLLSVSRAPEDFELHKNVAKVFETRMAMVKGEHPLDWSAGETLAYASLLTDGISLRLTGQDSERGTFTHRHAVVRDMKTGRAFTPLAQLASKGARCAIYNSPLSEMGCLGFEFGYSMDYPDALVLWEAQFGDFANNAQVVIDQFIAAAEDKWRRLCGLTLLLPHGYEGQGPEHSSARLERFLELCGEDNMQVCYPTTPAQIFHLLRRQALRPLRKPLVVMSPKSLLRKPEASSALDAFTQGRFMRVLPPSASVEAAAADRLILCTGKVYYDVEAARAARKDTRTAVVRVEQLHPFPAEELRQVLGQLPKVREVYWVQEEPKNMGAWNFVASRLMELFVQMNFKNPGLTYVGRVASASPATGFLSTHNIEQQALVEQALLRGKNGR